MSVDKETVEKISHLARINLRPEELAPMCAEINALLAFDEQLNEVNTDGIEPMVSSLDSPLYMRADKILVKNQVDDIIKNAPRSEDGFFIVPKVVE